MLQQVKRWAVCLGVLSVLVVGSSRPAAATDGVIAGGGTLGSPNNGGGPFQISITQQGAAVAGRFAWQNWIQGGGWEKFSFQATGGDIATTVTGYLEFSDSSGQWYSGPGALTLLPPDQYDPRGYLTIIEGDPVHETRTQPVLQGQIILQTR